MTDKNETIQMRASSTFRRRIADWRRQQPDLPSEAEAIRRLVERSLDADAVPAKKLASKA